MAAGRRGGLQRSKMLIGMISSVEEKTNDKWICSRSAGFTQAHKSDFLFLFSVRCSYSALRMDLHVLDSCAFTVLSSRL